MENAIFNSVMADVLHHVDFSDTTNVNVSFSVEKGCVVMKQDNWVIKFEGDGIVRIDNQEYGFGTQGYDDHAYYAKNGDFIKVCKERYVSEYKIGKVWEQVNFVIRNETEAYKNLYENGKISMEYRNKKINELNGVKHRRELFDAMK